MQLRASPAARVYKEKVRAKKNLIIITLFVATTDSDSDRLREFLYKKITKRKDYRHFIILILYVDLISIDNRRDNMSNSNIPTDKQYPKLSKASSGYLQIEYFKNADLHTGYFCYNCMYFIKDNHCAIVEDSGPDVRGEESGIIAPHGVCTLWDPNEEEAR